MPITRTDTITGLLSIGSTVDLTHYKTSINDDIKDIKYIVSNVYDNYMEEIMMMCVEIRFTDDEYHKFRYRPKLLSYQLYNTTDLAFILAKVNNIVSDKDFDFRVLNVIRPDMIEQLFRIYEEERKYLRTINVKNVLSINDFYYSEEGRISDERDKFTQDGPTYYPDIGGGYDPVIPEERPPIPSLPGGGINDDMYNELLQIIRDLERELKDMIGDNDSGTYDELLQLITNLELEITNINNTILEILEGLIRDDLEDVINSLIDSKLNERLDNIIARIEDLESRIPEILEGHLADILEKIEDIFDRLAKLEAGDFSGAGIKTRDVVIRMSGRFELGVDLDTEFRIPYVGNIISSTIAINIASKRKSNILFSLQMYNDVTYMWDDISLMDLAADRKYDTFTINKRVDGTYIRIYIKSGDVELIDGASVILTVLEDSVADAMKGTEKE